MTWYQILALGVTGGLIVGGVFFTLGVWLDRRDRKSWEREMDDMRDESGA